MSAKVVQLSYNEDTVYPVTHANCVQTTYSYNSNYEDVNTTSVNAAITYLMQKIEFLYSQHVNSAVPHSKLQLQTHKDWPESYVGINDYDGETFMTNSRVQDATSLYVGARRATGKRITDVLCEDNIANPAYWFPWVAWRFQDGRVSWTFQGLTIYDTKMYDSTTRTTYELWTPETSYNNFNPKKFQYAKKREWDMLLDYYFKSNGVLHGVDECIEDLKEVLGEPPFKHKIFMGIPATHIFTDNWGELNGENLDFRSAYSGMWWPSDPNNFVNGQYDEIIRTQFEFNQNNILGKNQENRKTALKYFIDKVIRMWDEAHFKNINLEGFYWMDEDTRYGSTFIDDADGSGSKSISSNKYRFSLIRSISEYIKSLDCTDKDHVENTLVHTWSPYLTASGAEEAWQGEFSYLNTQSAFTIKPKKFNFNDTVTTALNLCRGKRKTGYPFDTSNNSNNPYLEWRDWLLDDNNQSYLKRGFCFEFYRSATSTYWCEYGNNFNSWSDKIYFLNPENYGGYYYDIDLVQSDPNYDPEKITNPVIQMNDRLSRVCDYFDENNLWDRRFAHCYYDDGDYLYLIHNKLSMYRNIKIPSNIDAQATFRNEVPNKRVLDTTDRILRKVVERQNIVYESCPIMSDEQFKKYQYKYYTP